MPICICQTGKLTRCKNSAKNIHGGVCGLHVKATQGSKIIGYFQVDPDWVGKIAVDDLPATGGGIPRICIFRRTSREWEITADNPRTFVRVPLTAIKPGTAVVGAVAAVAPPIIVKKKPAAVAAVAPKTPKTPKPAIFLNDAQPTHRKSIVQSVVNSIDKLKTSVKIESDKERFTLFRELLYKLRYYSYVPMTDKIASDRGKALDMLVYYSSGVPVFDIGGVTTTIEQNDIDAYGITSFELSLLVYKRARDLAVASTKDDPENEELKKRRDEQFSEFLTRFTQELYESRGMCAAGRITRIINSLSGFDPNILVGVSPSEMMQSRMAVILASASEVGEAGSKEYNDHALDLIYKALVEAGMPETEWEPWIMKFM